jgi:hypothetical protein
MEKPEKMGCPGSKGRWMVAAARNPELGNPGSSVATDFGISMKFIDTV